MPYAHDSTCRSQRVQTPTPFRQRSHSMASLRSAHPYSQTSAQSSISPTLLAALGKTTHSFTPPVSPSLKPKAKSSKQANAPTQHSPPDSDKASRTGIAASVSATPSVFRSPSASSTKSTFPSKTTSSPKLKSTTLPKSSSTQRRDSLFKPTSINAFCPC